MAVDDEGFDETMDENVDPIQDESVVDEVHDINESQDGDPNETPSRSTRSSRGPSTVATAKTPRTPSRRSAAPKTPRTVKSVQKPKKGKKKKGRKSDALDLSALTNEQAALAALESNHILHLRLRKRYYAEGLNFIRQVEGSMEVLGELLGSRNKPEVLEAMEFFRVAHEYQFASAAVCDRVFRDAFLANLDIADWYQEDASSHMVKG